MYYELLPPLPKSPRSRNVIVDRLQCLCFLCTALYCKSTPPQAHHVHQNKRHDSLIRRKAPKTLPQCHHKRLLNVLQPLPAPPSNHKPPPQSSPPHLLSRSNMHWRQWRRERFLPACRQRKGYRCALPRHQSPRPEHPGRGRRL